MEERETAVSAMPPGDSARTAKAAAIELAYAAGVEDLAAGAAVGGEPGRSFRGRLLADQLTAGHGVMMKLAAKANYAIGNAECMGVGEAGFDRQAARLADMSSRMMDRYRRGLQALGRLAGPAGEPEIWEGHCWIGDPPLDPAERARRIARERKLMARARLGGPPPSAVSLAALAAAAEAAWELTVQAGAAALAADRGSAPRQRLFMDQLAAAHRLMMRLAGRADWWLTSVDAEKIDGEDRERAVNGVTGAAGRLMDRFRHGLLMLERQESGPAGGPAKVVGQYWAGPDTGYMPPDPEGAEAGRGSPGSAPAAGRGPGIVGAAIDPGARRGRLRHGNPSGDFLSAPRCGACTRAGHGCRQPAMANGRCRFHGGKSTGPRTAAGLRRSRASRLVHGGRSAEVINLRAAAAAIGRNLRRLIAESEVVPLAGRTGERSGTGLAVAGHGVHRRVFREFATPAALVDGRTGPRQNNGHRHQFTDGVQAAHGRQARLPVRQHAARRRPDPGRRFQRRR